MNRYNKMERYSGKILYNAWMEQDEVDSGVHQCKSCKKKLKQNLKKGYTTITNHIKSVHADIWKEEMERIHGNTANGSMLAHITTNVTKKAQLLYSWLEWVIMCDHPFEFVNNKYTKKYTSLEPICDKTLKKYMQSLCTEVESTIKKIIPQNFGLIFDGKSTVILIYVYLL